MNQPPRVSIVVPMFNEKDNVDALHAEIVSAMSAAGGGGGAWEVLYVDDGSTDGTYERLREAQGSHPGLVSVIRLRRNFGQTAALAAGFNHARGGVIVTIDGDLQNDPADIPRVLEEVAHGHDVVSGWRRNRVDPFLSRRLPSRAANWLIGVVTGVALHDYGCTLKAYRREVVEQMTLYGEMHRFLPAQAHWVGARIGEIPVRHRPRTKGESKYGLWRTYRVLLDLVTVRFLGTHGTKPLHAFGALGLAFGALGVLTMGVLSYLKFTTGVSFIQSPLLLLSALFVMLGGQSLLLGLLAEISVRTYYESQQKPIYVIKEIHRAGPEAGPPEGEPVRKRD
ncbi:MAG TPA: glycosyltransferase family 2 protein [Candidatus Polarisedimenticolia bacterium]|jgi:glycosyltransferase involved in cell wall biosynthesis|nr:glycosyltransferase family 2 protein [Candidatus Polarisedimenticolia bacterium]